MCIFFNVKSKFPILNGWNIGTWFHTFRCKLFVYDIFIISTLNKKHGLSRSLTDT